MRKKLFIVFLTALLATPSAVAAQSPNNELNLAFSSFDIAGAVTNGGGSRGPALAVMQDGTMLLGGGDAGGEIFLVNVKTQKLRKLGSLIPVNKRQIDSRFAITDIAVLSENKKRANLLISYPRLGSNNRCVEVAVDQIRYNRAKQKVNRIANWFVTKPCVPISAVQHASGRFAVINNKSAYVTIGDLGFPGINDRSKRGDLGSIFKVSATNVERISQGHRNAQGIVLFNGKDLLAAEHGPRGGDELNLIKPGNDYGWPFVTHGEPYSSGDYVKPTKTGTHQGYVEPLKYWTPSIAPTELVQLPAFGWGEWGGALVLGTLRENVLVFMKLDNKFNVTQTKMTDLGQRIRDLEINKAGNLVATTDEGRLFEIKQKN
ncbi:MAG: PQQ-dependent sugar dehydrogenase [Actinobacteria bacterium]|nr:PQQ-dependent sugar dehydrogenase [Actinomycetota bacterium]